MRPRIEPSGASTQHLNAKIALLQIKAIQACLSYKEVPVSSLRRLGVSKISGTVRGTIGAAIGIFSMGFKLYWSDIKFFASLKSILE